MDDFDPKYFHLIGRDGKKKVFSISWVFEQEIYALAPIGFNKEVRVRVLSFLNHRNPKDMKDEDSSHAFVVPFLNGETPERIDYVVEYKILGQPVESIKTELSATNSHFDNCLRFEYSKGTNFNTRLVNFSHDVSGSKIFGINFDVDTDYEKGRVMALLLPAYCLRNDIDEPFNFLMVGLFYSLENPGPLKLRTIQLLE